MKNFFDTFLHRLCRIGIGRYVTARRLTVFFCGLLLVTGAGKASAASVFLPPEEAEEVQSSDPVCIYLFWGDGCPHCAQAKPCLESLAQRNPRVVLRDYELYHHTENHAVFEAFGAAVGFEPHYVPTIVIGTRYWVGWDEQVAREVEDTVSACLIEGCPDAGAGIVSPLPTARPAAAPTGTPRAGEPTPEPFSQIIRVPLFGEVDLTAQSLTVGTILIALVDGFNPCSLWVLTMLLALTLHTGSRRKVLVIGLIFLTVTAAIYGLFITGLFTMFTILSFTGWIRVIVALVALFFALVNLKDYFWYKEGLSFTISDRKKPGIARRIRNLMDPNLSFWSLAGGTAVLAAGVSLVEFSCTAGFPFLWTNLLAEQGAGTASFVLLLLLYLAIYQADELAIFGAAVYSLKASRLEEEHGRILKLVGGVLMLTLAAVMLIKPSLMNDLGSSLIIFGIALSGVLVVLLMHRVILPRMGVRIGSEFSKKRQHRFRSGNR
jgi:glutaredoxin